MKNLFAVLILFFHFAASAQDKVAYRWVYSLDEATRKYVPSTLRLFDHAYEFNMKYMFSCISRYTEQKFGIVAATLHCKKNLSDDQGRMRLKGNSFENDFKPGPEGNELKISILNRDVGFNKMVGCLAGRTRYKAPSLDEATINDCLQIITANQSEADLFRMKFVPTTKALSTEWKGPKSSDELSENVSVYFKCLSFNGRKGSKSFPDDDELFNYCYTILESYMQTKDKVHAFVPTKVDFYKSNYSPRVLYALEQVNLQQNQHSPLNLAIKMQYDSEVALKLYEIKVQEQEDAENRIPYPIRFLYQNNYGSLR